VGLTGVKQAITNEIVILKICVGDGYRKLTVLIKMI
jgi:hypothetical protein